MARYLLDTGTLVDLANDREPVRAGLTAMLDAGDDLGVCAVQLAEFFAGVPVEGRAAWDAFFAVLSYWGIDRETALLAGVYRHDFARRDQQLSTADTLIAAVARQERAVIVTDNNARHSPMDGVRTLSPRA